MNDQSDPRPEGIYCSWRDYNQTLAKGHELQIERVRGDGTVAVFTCTVGEAAVILRFLRATNPDFISK